VAPAVGEPSLHRSIAATTGTSATATTVPAAEGDEEVVPTNMELRQQLEHAQDEIRHYRSIIMASTTSDIHDIPHNSSSNKNINDTENNHPIAIWKEKVALLEQERIELQGCLDEALMELEAVDLELQQESDPNHQHHDMSFLL
jgi:hypothetical protein